MSVQTFTLSKRGNGHLWLKPENECSFSDETLIQVIEAVPVLDILEELVWGSTAPKYDVAKALLREQGRLKP